MMKNNSKEKAVGTVKTLCAAVLLMTISLTHIEARAQSVTLNLKDADIGAVIATVADVTGKNFIVDPRVKAKVTVISARPMSKDEVYQVFLSLLEVNGFAAVPIGKVIKIIPDTNAKQSTAPVTNDNQPGRGDEYVTRVIHLKNVSAAQLVPVLRPLSPQQAHMVAYPGTNALIIADRAANIERLAKIVEDIDQPGEDAEVEVMALKHAAAAEVTRILMALDQEARKTDPAGAAGVVDRPVLIADERTNSILMGGGKSGRLRMRALVSHLDTPLETGGNIRVVYLRYAKAKDLVPVLTGVASQVQDKARGAAGAAPSPAGGGPPGSGINIQADESTNALVITAPPDVFRSLQVVISQLDVRRAQVLVEAVIAEVTTSRAAELGVQWATFDRTQGTSNPVGLTNFTNGTAGSSIAEIGGAIARNVPPALGPGMTFGLGKFASDGFSFAALIRALQSDGSSNVLSTPTLVTMDNSDAEIVVGQNVPFITGAFATPVAGAGATPVNPFQTIQRQNVGLTLKVKPQINEGNAIKMDIEQKVDSLSTSAVRGAADLITNTRSIKTSVMVDDGKVVVLGGLITEDMKENVQKVPLLGDLPLIGNLFRYKRNSKDKTNLMVFLHPVIMRDGELAERMTSGKYNFIRATQIDAKLKDRGLLRNEQLPMLPPMDELMKLPPPFEAGGGQMTTPDGRAN
ncbi:MAG: type II secretion system secretin GspD [Pseudomonadota bacterium]